MDTFDTIRFISDTILVKTSEMANNSQSIMENKGAGWTDVLITFFVCATIAIIAIYGFIRFFTWKKYVYDRDIEQKNKKREWEVEDIKREQNAEYRKLILEFTKDPYLEKDRKFNTEATKVDDSHPYIARLLSYIETPSQNNQTNHQ